LESSSQKHQETLTIAAANAHTREEELQRLLAAASANEQQALKVCKEMEASTAQLQTQVKVRRKRGGMTGRRFEEEL